MNKMDKTNCDAKETGVVAPAISERDLADLGDGVIAYIKVMTTDEAQDLFPSIEDLPIGANLYALHGADGTPIALTDSRDAALSHAFEGELEIASLH